MMIYSLLAAVVLGLHLLFIVWVVFGALLTRPRPLLRWLHLATLVSGVLVEILPWPWLLSPAENWLWGHAGLTTLVSPPLFGRDGLPRCAARPPDLRCRRCLPIQSRNLHCPLPTPAQCRLVNRTPKS